MSEYQPINTGQITLLILHFTSRMTPSFVFHLILKKLKKYDSAERIRYYVDTYADKKKKSGVFVLLVSNTDQEKIQLKIIPGFTKTSYNKVKTSI